jgi:transcriptional regulator EpsA
MSTLNVAPDQSEVLLRVIEAAPQVHRRHQFFLWSQGDFQRWLPHKISVCGSYDRDQREVVFDIFNSVPIPDEILHGLKSARSELMQAAMTNWHRARHQACRLPLALVAETEGLKSALSALGYDEVLMHGIHRPGRPEEIESFFLFAQPHDAFSDGAQQALDMLLPCLHVAYQRVCSTERQMVVGRTLLSPSNGQPYQRTTPITEREREILLWVRDGLSNQQISEKLGISALTVKNHVQKILRKLGAANRAQAVAKAMTMNALSMVPQPMMGDFS